MPDEIAVWETEGGYSPPEPDSCVVCGETRAPAMLVRGYWQCLRHSVQSNQYDIRSQKVTR